MPTAVTGRARPLGVNTAAKLEFGIVAACPAVETRRRRQAQRGVLAAAAGRRRFCVVERWRWSSSELLVDADFASARRSTALSAEHGPVFHQ